MKDLPERFSNYAASSDRDVSRVGAPRKSEDWAPLSEVQADYVARVLHHTGGNKQAAARVLGVDRKTLDRMIKRHHIEYHRDSSSHSRQSKTKR